MDLYLNFHCNSNVRIISSGARSYIEIIHNPVVTSRKVHPPYQTKQSKFKKIKWQQNNISSTTNVDVILLHQSNLNHFNTYF